MTKRIVYLAATASALATLAASSAQAKYVAIFQEIGANVEEIGGGTLDTTELLQNAAGIVTPGVRPGIASFESGAFGEASVFIGISGPSDFGAGVFTPVSSSSGDGLALVGEFTELLLPLNYSGQALSESSTY